MRDRLYMRGDRVRYTARHPDYHDDRFIGRTGTVNADQTRRSHSVNVDWDAQRGQKKPPGGVFYENVELIQEHYPTAVQEALRLLRQHGTVTFEMAFQPIRVKLNDTYEALVQEHEVRVGCQHFPFEVIERLHEAVQKAKVHKSFQP